VRLPDEVRAFLEEVRFGVLATVNADGSPQQTVMWYEPRGETVMMNTLRGRKKDRNLGRDPRASLCVEAGLRYVALSGTIEMIDDAERGQAGIAALARRYEGAAKAAELVRDTFRHQERITLLLHVERFDAHGFDGDE
jgi:PPOX class probable F420-dependent enzyme